MPNKLNLLKITDILYDLLTEHNRVSIPCLGSFVAELQPASLSDNRWELHPPYKKISFNSKEIWNDEHLERELAVRKKCSLAEARELVAFWVDDLCFKLATEGCAKLESIGTLTIFGNNQIDFTIEPGINLLKNAYGLTSVSVRRIPVVEHKEESTQPIKKKRPYTWLIVIAVVLALAVAVVYLYNHQILFW